MENIKEEQIKSKWLALAKQYREEWNMKIFEPLSEEEITKLEKKHNVTFPMQYRAFIANVSACHLISDDNTGFEVSELFKLNDDWKAPFPFTLMQATESLNKIKECYFQKSEEYQNRDWDTVKDLFETSDFEKDFEDVFIADEETEAGCLTLNDEGEWIDHLVMNGEMKGWIWRRGSTDEWYPHCQFNNGKIQPVFFWDWLNSYLENR